MVPAGRAEGIPIGEHGQPRGARGDGVRSLDWPEAGGDLFGAPVDDVAGDEAARGLEGLDGEAGAGGEDVVLAVEHHQARRALDDVFELEAELREAGERALVELADGAAAAQRAVPSGSPSSTVGLW